MSDMTPKAPSRLARHTLRSRQMLLLTLLFFGAVGLHRTWDLRSYTGDALGLLTSRKRAYSYLHLERFLSEVARANGAEVLTDALAGWTAQLWLSSDQEEAHQSTHFYIDGHRKPVYTQALIPRGLVGRLSTILGCRALVLLHDASGHPLLATTHRGDQHLTVGLPAMVKRYEQRGDAGRVEQIVVDREGMAAEFLAGLKKAGRTVISVLEPISMLDSTPSPISEGLVLCTSPSRARFSAR